MSGGNIPENITTTNISKQELSPEQTELIGSIMPTVKDFAANPPTAFQGPTFAGFDPNQKAAQQRTLDLSQPGSKVSNITDKAAEAQNFALGDVLRPESNPALQANIRGAIRPLQDTFNQQIMPAITNQAIEAGSKGGSREGVAQGIASQALLNQTSDISAQLANQAYQGGLDTFSKGLALAPQTAGLQTLPALLQESVGAQGQQLEQAGINDAIQKFVSEQLLPFQAAQQVGNIAFGLPGGGTMQENIGTNPNVAPGFGSSLLGGGAQGASLAGMIPGLSPGVGAGLGALAQLVF